MEIVKKSMLTGEDRTINIPLTDEEFRQCYYLWKSMGWCIQDAFPTLSEEQRTFILTGMTVRDWEQLT